MGRCGYTVAITCSVGGDWRCETAGYAVRFPWKVLDAAHFGVPQHRERLILIGAKKGTPLPEYPEPRTSPADGRRSIDGLPAGPTCEDALSDLPDADRFAALEKSDAVRTAAFKEPSAYAAELRSLTNDAWHFGYVRNWKPVLLTSSARTRHTEISKRRFHETQPGTVEPISRFYRLSPTGLSNTLRAGTDGSRGAFTSPRPIHYALDRCITVREMARLHGFPDWFRLHVTKWHGARQIGNAVAPPMARAIAEQIMLALCAEPIRPEKQMDLGEERLLQLEMTEAAEEFGVPRPNNRRDRKSGAKKRKQQEIEEKRQALMAVAYA